MSEPTDFPERASEPPTTARRRRIASDRLMGGLREIVIEHGADEYRLRVTGSGKLILTK